MLLLYSCVSKTTKQCILIRFGVLFLFQYILYYSNAFTIRTNSRSANSLVMNRKQHDNHLSRCKHKYKKSIQSILYKKFLSTELHSTSSSHLKNTDKNKKGMKSRKKSDSSQQEKKIQQKQQPQQPQQSQSQTEQNIDEEENSITADIDNRQNFDSLTIKKKKSDTVVRDETASTTKVYPKDSVVSRLKNAAKQALLLQQSSSSVTSVGIDKNDNTFTLISTASSTGSSSTTTPSPVPSPRIASLRQLTAAIDQKLQSTSITNNYMMTTTTNTYNNRRQRIQQPARDSMTAVIVHNDKTLSKAKNDEMLVTSSSLASTTATATTTTTTSDGQQLQQQTQNNNMNNDMLLTMMMSSSGTVPFTTKIPTVVITKNIAIVFSKPLINDQVSIECATRVRRLIRSMVGTASTIASTYTNTNTNTIPSSIHNMSTDLESYVDCDSDTDAETTSSNDTLRTSKTVMINNTNSNNEIINDQTPYKPDLICFVGGKYGNNLLNDCDVCYAFFRNLCTTNHISINDIQFHLLPSYVQEGAIESFCDTVETNFIPQWLQEIASETVQNGILTQQKNQNQQLSSTTESSSNIFDDNNDDTETYASKVQSINFNRLKMKLHFTLVSSEYHLCILNDIHVRSPNQSPLRPFVAKRWNTNIHQNLPTGFRGEGVPTIEVSWTYQYATTTTIPIADPLQAFASKCYKIAQELIPVLQNLRGVVNNLEFFQQDNYRVLVAARRSLVSDMEELYRKQPSLQSVRRRVGNAGTVNSGSVMSQQNLQQQQQQVSNSEQNQQITVQQQQQQQPQSKTLDVILESALLSMGRCLDLVRPAGLLTGSVTLNEYKIALRVLEQAVQQITVSCDPDKPIHPFEWSQHLFANNATTAGIATTATNRFTSLSINSSTTIDSSNTD